MGINPTQPNHKAFTFDGTSSRDYGVYITGEGVFNAPQRDVQMVDIPGRNGAYALDKGNFNNITVKYPASIVADNETDFAEAVSDLRNFLCSKTGYCRLEDEYNPNEYRMAIYKSGLEVSHDMLTAGEFDITFECKPQRWLTSGEELITIGEWRDVQTAEGAVATFEADSATRIKSLTVDIDPIQDLHGYDSPWVGGAGVNKFDATKQTIIDANKVSLSGETFTMSWTDGSIMITGRNVQTFPAGTYYFSAVGTGDMSNVRFGVYNASTNTAMRTSVPNFSFTATQEFYLIIYGLYNAPGTATFKVQIEQGSTATAWTPYENICPISGRNSVEVTVTDDLVDPTDTDTYTTSLGTTVYGGTLDVVSGVLTIDKVAVDLGSLNWDFSGGVVFINYTTQIDLHTKERGGYVLSDRYVNSGTKSALNMADGTIQIMGGASTSNIWIKDSAYTSGSAFKTAMDGVYIVYELADAYKQTIQLTPTQVQTLLGTNNIFADSGDVTVEYGQNPMVLVNPTLFDARPQLQVYGYGDIDLGGQSVKVNNVSIGSVLIANSQRFNAPEYESLIASVGCDVGMLNNGDDILVSNIKSSIAYQTNTGTFLIDGTGIVINSTTNATANAQLAGPTKYSVTVTADDITFSKGTSASSTATVSQTINYKISGVAYSKSTVFTIVTSYDGNDTISFSASVSNITSSDVLKYLLGVKSNDIYGDSSKSALGNPLYIDLDIGECWNEDSGTPVSINNAVTLPAELPTLPIGNTTITFDNTFTQVDIVPRWWKV